jgi:hypothetical protein
MNILTCAEGALLARVAQGEDFYGLSDIILGKAPLPACDVPVFMHPEERNRQR